MKQIKDLKIDISEMPTAETNRKFTVTGDVGAKFILHVVQDDTLNFYNFSNKTFELGHNSKNNNLEVLMESRRYYDNIIFPSGGGSYTVTLVSKDPAIIISNSYSALDDSSAIGENNNNLTSTSFKSSIISKNIKKQASNATITFKAFTANTGNYGTFPTSTTVGALNDSGTADVNWSITNATTDAGGFGLRLNGKYSKNKSWYFTTTDTVDGAISPSDKEGGFKVKVDDITDIGVGSNITAVSAGSLVGTPSILAIDESTKVLTLSGAQTFADGITLTFIAIGSKAINYAIGSNITFPGVLNTFGQKLTQKVRANVSASTTVTLSDTQGIAGGDLIGYHGIGVNNATSNLITSVTPDPGGGDGDGSMVVELAQTLTAGTVLSFDNIHKTVSFSGKISIQGYPSASKTIFLDLDPIITVGAAS